MLGMSADALMQSKGIHMQIMDKCSSTKTMYIHPFVGDHQASIDDKVHTC